MTAEKIESGFPFHSVKAAIAQWYDARDAREKLTFDPMNPWIFLFTKYFIIKSEFLIIYLSLLA